MNSLVVQTLFAGTERLSVERWFAATVDALSRVDPFAVGAWTIESGDLVGDGAISAEVVAQFKMRAAAVGGDFFMTYVEGKTGRLEAHRWLARNAGDSLILILDSDVTVLTSTIDRLVNAAAGGAIVTPRELPLAGAYDEDGAVPDVGCILLRAAQLDDPGALSTVYEDHPEAVVYRDRGLPKVPNTDKPSSRTGSLLEGVLEAASMESARRALQEEFSTEVDPLLSIVMRTQLRRPEALRDALLCVAGQADPRFELLLVVHDADAGGAKSILSDQPVWLQERARVLSASGGSRSRPLNVGIAAARGSHISFLDDDDVVFAHWVGSALQAAELFPRQLVRSVAGVQWVTTTQWPGPIEGHVVESKLTIPYPAKFNLADHLRVNMTPFMSVAFPSRFFERLGGADESLEVCEDWDLVLRAASVLGVADVGQVTSIYRRWASGLDSYSVHDSGVWARDMQRVRAKLDASPLVLPPLSASELAAMAALRDSPSELLAVYRSTSWRVTAPLRAVSRLMSRLRRIDA